MSKGLEIWKNENKESEGESQREEGGRNEGGRTESRGGRERGRLARAKFSERNPEQHWFFHLLIHREISVGMYQLKVLICNKIQRGKWNC